MIKYPEQLPRPLQDGYKLNTEDPKLSSTLNSGRIRERRRFTYVPTTIKARWNMDEDQMAFFESWFARTLIDGTLWFEATLQTPVGIQLYECKILGMYDGPALVQFNRFEITATLLLRKRPLIDPGWEIFPEFWFNKNIIDMAINREWPMALPQYLLVDEETFLVTDLGERLLLE